MRETTYESVHAELLARMRAGLARRDIGEIRKLSRRIHRLRSAYRKRFPRAGAA